MQGLEVARHSAPSGQHQPLAGSVALEEVVGLGEGQ